MTIAEKLENEITSLVNELPNLRNNGFEYSATLSRINDLIDLYNKNSL